MRVKYQASEVGVGPLLACGQEHALAGEAGARAEHEDEHTRRIGAEWPLGDDEVGSWRVGDPIGIAGYEVVFV